MDKKDITRRDFFKLMGATGLAATGLAACSGQDDSHTNATPVPTGTMTRRTLTGDSVSLLGYGCMRCRCCQLPTAKEKWSTKMP